MCTCTCTCTCITCTDPARACYACGPGSAGLSQGCDVACFLLLFVETLPCCVSPWRPVEYTPLVCLLRTGFVHKARVRSRGTHCFPRVALLRDERTWLVGRQAPSIISGISGRGILSLESLHSCARPAVEPVWPQSSKANTPIRTVLAEAWRACTGHPLRNE